MTEKTHQTPVLELKAIYCSELDDLGKDFFTPCLKLCIAYDRAAGYFSTGALRSWAGAVKNLISENNKIRLIVSPELGEKEWLALKNAVDPEIKAQIFELGIEHFMEKALLWENGTQPSDREIADLLAWLIAAGKVEIRFAFNLSKGLHAGIFHKKIGVFLLREGNKVAFTGSANESWSGHSINSESIDVYRSWVSEDNCRITAKEAEFERCWNPLNNSLLVKPISMELLERIRKYDEEFGITSRKISTQPQPDQSVEPNDLWPHQIAAIKELLIHRHGVLEMATGTGKTRTALAIIDYLFRSRELSTAIVTMAGNDLLRQWEIDLRTRLTSKLGLMLLRSYDGIREEERLLLSPKNKVLLCSRENLQHVIKQIQRSGEMPPMAIIHDEVHDLGSPGNQAGLANHGQYFAYRIGLSATPERDYDADGNKFIESEIGPVIFQYGLEEAIREGVLCPFDYFPLPYSLMAEDREGLKSVYSRQAAALKIGVPWPPEKLWIELSRVYKRAKMKPAVFSNFLNERHKEGFLQSTIIFVEDKEFAEFIYPHIIKRTHRFSSYFDYDSPEILENFANGKIDCLVTCHKLSQGIDLPSLRNVVLFSSQSGRRETIQRLGRCLRRDSANPGKIARVVDFQLNHENDSGGRDDDRVTWLSALAQVRRESESNNS
jgi:superfamily II DNA or RNA helicase